MKLKLAHNDICFRITAEELALLREGQRLEETVNIGGVPFTYIIDLSGDSDTLRPVFQGGDVILKTSPQTVQRLADLGRSREGLEVVTDDGSSVSLQVDFRTQKAQRSSARHQAS